MRSEPSDTLHSTLGLLKSLHIKISVIVFTSGNVLWLIALEAVYVEDCPKTAPVGPGSAFNADVELPAVCGVSVSAVETRLVDIRGVGAHESFGYFELVAPLYEIGPHAHPLFRVVCEAWWTLIAGGLSVPARIKYAAVVFVGVDTVETRTVGSADWRLKICSFSAVDTEGIGAVFSEGIGIVEHQTISTHL